jgi:hypothetical protein
MFAPIPLQKRIAPQYFGRRRPFTFAAVDRSAGAVLADDARLFLATFLGGLLFMTIYLA